MNLQWIYLYPTVFLISFNHLFIVSLISLRLLKSFFGIQRMEQVLHPSWLLWNQLLESHYLWSYHCFLCFYFLYSPSERCTHWASLPLLGIAFIVSSFLLKIGLNSFSIGMLNTSPVLHWNVSSLSLIS